MKYDAALDEFLVRFYRWSLEDFQLQVKEDFALLRVCPDRGMAGFLRFIEGLSIAERQALGPALVKRFHERAVELTREALTPAERKWVDRYLAALAKFRQERRVETTGPPPKRKESPCGLTTGAAGPRASLCGNSGAPPDICQPTCPQTV